MLLHTIRRLVGTVARRTPAGFVVAAFAFVLLAWAWNSPVGNAQAAMKHPVEKTSYASAAESEVARLASLRREAASGDELSNLQLTQALLDRYDLRGDSDDLYEALEWIDRHWETSGNAELVDRVVSHYCGQRVVQWNRLCVSGE